MEKVSFSVKPRIANGSRAAGRLRKSQRAVPGVIYGGGQSDILVYADLIPLEHVYMTFGESTILDLQVEGGKKEDVLIHEVQYHPVTNELTHVDFLRVDYTKEVVSTVGLKVIGNSEAVRMGGALFMNKHEVDITCLPGDLIHEIEVDITLLATADDVIKVSHLKTPKGVKIVDTAEDIVAHIEMPVLNEDNTAEDMTV